MGICGTGMAALAGMLKSAGFHVSGSDQHIYPPMSDFLARCGIEVASGYSAANLSPRPDLAVVGNVITRINPEAQALIEGAIPYVSMPQALRHYFLRDKISLVVAGTHGKTTTSSLLATLLHDSRLAPGFMIGGLVKRFNSNFNLGSGKFFVVEGDEYDTAFFDKGPKFLHYQPHLAIVTSIEFDHADIYHDLAAVKESFRKLVRIMPPDGCLIACLDDPVVREIVRPARCRVMGYGIGDGTEWQLRDLAISNASTTFTVHNQGKPFGTFQSPMVGRHNALNSLAVIALLTQLGVKRKTIAGGLQGFEGVKRRQEVRGEVDNITVIDDFAHHPTAVRETLEALKKAYDGRRLLAVFEPRTNTSRRNIFQQTYVTVFDQADEVLVKEPAALVGVPPSERFSARQLVNDLTGRGVTGHYFAATDEIIDHLADASKPGDVIAIMSNGSFDNIHERLLARMRQNRQASWLQGQNDSQIE